MIVSLSLCFSGTLRLHAFFLQSCLTRDFRFLCRLLVHIETFFEKRFFHLKILFLILSSLTFFSIKGKVFDTVCVHCNKTFNITRVA